QWGFESIINQPDAEPISTVTQPQPATVTSSSFKTLQELEASLNNCRLCPLCEQRKNIVFGAGNPQARLVLVGEAPGREEDEKGYPFVGEAGKLLDKILLAMHLSRDEVYICNVLKCRPPGNRDPQADEIAACEPFLQHQLELIHPEVIVTLGRFAAQELLKTTKPIGKLRGYWHAYEGIPLMPTFHPAYLLRNPSGKRPVWEDMKQVMQRLSHS
ncbi:MAG: uracil-DNA glycosylase, partial [Thermodesulfobacteriota bacterium]|nr:uracil-DNA glycosylase [Thermodesulfobacteriota bacterium]